MAEKHQKTTITSIADVMYAIFTMVQTSGQTAVRWADYDNAPNGSRAIYSGTAFIAASSVTAATFSNSASYMVIESSVAMPSGRRWQVKISRSGTTTNLYVNMAPRGSWNYLTPGFDYTNYPYTGWNGTSVVETTLDALGGATPNGTGRVLVSTSDLDTYGSNTTYAYLRVLIWDNSGGSIVKGFYVGGYIPFDQTNNTNPVVLLTRWPYFNNSASAASWGYGIGNASNYNRISPDYTGATRNLNAAGYAYVACITTTIVNRDPNGNWVNFPLYVRCIDDAAFFGYFGRYTMFAGDTSRSLATADSNGEYLTVNDLIMRWKPTA